MMVLLCECLCCDGQQFKCCVKKSCFRVVKIIIRQSQLGTRSSKKIEDVAFKRDPHLTMR